MRKVHLLFRLEGRHMSFSGVEKVLLSRSKSFNPPTSHQKPLVSGWHVFSPNNLWKGFTSYVMWRRGSGEEKTREKRWQSWKMAGPKTTKGRDGRRTAGMRREAGWIDERRFGKSTLWLINICRTHIHPSSMRLGAFHFHNCVHTDNCVIRPNGAPLVSLPAADKKKVKSF